MKKLACLTIVFLFSLSVSLADEPEMYTNDTFARLSYINGNVYIQRAIELDYEEAMVNMLVAEGDRMGTTEGRAEIHLGKGKYLRLDTHTKMDFLSLPNPFSDLTRIQIWRGNIFFSIPSLKKEKAIEIHTDDASLYVLEPGLYRIDVREDETEIFVFRGLLEAAGETGSVLIKEAQRMESVSGHFLGRPSGFIAVAEDSFDRWNAGRDLQVRKRMAFNYLPEELEDFEYELAYYGTWKYIFPFGYVWIPAGIAPDWRPYWQGRWIWQPVCGWTWLPYEPWGWVAFHYGRWHWGATLGWYWIPTSVWGPGWVHWYSGFDYVGWAPAGFWGRPGVIIDNVYYGNNIDRPNENVSRALTVIHKDQLRARDISKVAISQVSARSIGQMSPLRTPPAVSHSKNSEVRLKSLKSSSASTPRRFYNPSTRMSEPESVDRVKITRSETKEKSEPKEKIEERNVPETSSADKSKKTSITLGKITRVLSNKSSESSSSKSSSTGRVKSGSITNTKSSSKVTKSSPPKSSAKKNVSSKKVKKKK